MLIAPQNLCLFLALLALAAYWARLLTLGGAIAAATVGTTTVLLGGVPAVALLFLFFFSSNLLGLYRKRAKQALGFEKGGRRDQWQVLANGGPALIGIAVLRFWPFHIIPQHSCIAVFGAGLAEANADTWATEIGSAVRGATLSIVSGKPIRKGQSGGISAAGTAAAFCGALLIASALGILTSPHSSRLTVAAVTIAGFCGALIDSILGATLQAQFKSEDGTFTENSFAGVEAARGLNWFRNDAVNFCAGISATAIAGLILLHKS